MAGVSWVPLPSIAQLRVVDGIKKTGGHSARWKLPAGGACFDLVMPGGVYPGGWVLFQGSLIRRVGDYDARLYYDLGAGFKEEQHFEIPA